MKQKTLDLNMLKAVRKEWYSLPEDAIPDNKREAYRMRKKAVDMYIDGAKVNEITRVTGIYASNLLRHIKKCLMLDETGNYYGYYALIPDVRFTSQKKAGPFYKLLKSYPDLVDYIAGNYFGDKKYTLEKNMNFKTLHEKFIMKCKELGIQDYEYPLNTQNMGYVSLIAYVKDLENKNLEKSASRENKDTRQKLLSTGIGTKYTSIPLLPYHTVQVDGHIIDLGYSIEVDNLDGTVSHVMATRPWLFAVIDVATRTIIGYALSQSFNYDQTVVLSAIRNAIEPHKEIKFEIPGLKYPANGGYPSLADSRLEYAMFDTIMLDNAKAHLAGNVLHKLVDTLGCSLNFGSVATPETRGIIERFFGTLETRGFHRLPGTTGSNIYDTKRKNPQEEAVRYNITFEQITELMEVLIAEYNNTPHSSLKNETPLECLTRKLQNPFCRPTIASEELKNEIHTLTFLTQRVTVRGGVSSGKRPYIQYKGAKYRNNILASSGEYVGKEITILIDPEDVSTVEAYNDKGYFLGTLTANGEYGRIPHSLKSRENALSLTRENGMKNREFSTPLTEYETYLKGQAKTSRRAATKADILRKENKKPTVSEQNKQAKKAEIRNLEQEKAQKHSNESEEIPTDPKEFYAKYFQK